jgi:hypothetical protein
VSSLLKVVNKLKDEQWTKIIESAWVCIKQKGLTTIVTVESMSSDFEIEDGDDDLKPQAMSIIDDDDDMYA